MNITELQTEEQELLSRLSENRKKQKELSAGQFTQKHGINIGDTVEWLDGKKQMKGVISDLYYGGMSPYWYIATLFKSNGELGKLDRTIYDTKSLKKIEQ